MYDNKNHLLRSHIIALMNYLKSNECVRGTCVSVCLCVCVCGGGGGGGTVRVRVRVRVRSGVALTDTFVYQEN